MPKPPKLELSHRYFLGIDPGKKGGLAIINDELEVVELALMPKGGGEFFRWLSYNLIKAGVGDLTVTLEKVHSMRGQGSQSTFTFGMELGKCEALINILWREREIQGIGPTNIITPTPQIWMKSLGIQKRVNDFKTKTLWKRHLRSVAKELFPKANLWQSSWWNEGRTDAVSDAMLIAYYGWLKSQ